jgi:hypothetical protein
MIVGRKASQNFSFESTHKVSLNREFSHFHAFKFRLKIFLIIYENNLMTSNEVFFKIPQFSQKKN